MKYAHERHSRPQMPAGKTALGRNQSGGRSSAPSRDRKSSFVKPLVSFTRKSRNESSTSVSFDFF